MGKSIWEILSPFTKTAPPEKEVSSQDISNTEATGAEAGNESIDSNDNSGDSGDAASNSTNEAPSDDSEAEASGNDSGDSTNEASGGDSEAEASGNDSADSTNEAPSGDSEAEASGDDSADSTNEAPSGDSEAEAASSESEPKPPLLFRIFQKLMSYKIVVDLCKFFMIIFLGIALVLTYGQIFKSEGCASFETIFSQFEANKMCNYFMKGKMDKLVAKVDILTPVNDYQKDWEASFRANITDSLTKLYEKKKLGKFAKKNKITCEYQKDSITGISHLVYTCYIQLTTKEEMQLILTKNEENQFSIVTVSNGKYASSLKKMTDYFTYLSNGYYQPSDYTISSILCSKKTNSFSKLSKLFWVDSDKKSTKNEYSKDIANRLSSLLASNVYVTDAVFSNYEYNPKTGILSTNLMLRFHNDSSGAAGVLYQPLKVGLYGYSPLEQSMFYPGYMDEITAAKIRSLFSL